MPRRRSEPPPPVIPTTALVASATRYSGKTPRIYSPKQDWQTECYRHYSICGEARYAAHFFGNALSRAVLRPARLTDTGPDVVTDGPARAYLDGLFNGPNGQREMLSAIGTHLTIAGECYLIGRDMDQIEGVEGASDVTLWEIVSVGEISVNGSKWQIKVDENKTYDLKDEDAVIRIWLPHPADRNQADSPFRSLLPILSEIEWLTRHIFAQITSRLAGAGILLMPQGMTFPPPQPIGGKEVVTSNNEAENFMFALADAMSAPIEDPSSPNAITPFVVTAPDQLIDKPRLLKFWSELDANAQPLRNELIRRFATGMDLPAEEILGMSSSSGTGGGTSNGVSHWGAWQIEESTIKMHVEPMLDVVVNALIMGYLRPLTEDPTALIVYDTSALRLRPDRSKEAMELWDRGVLKTSVMLTETGFNENDLPDEAEFKRWLLIKVASGSATPEQVQAALAALGVALAVEPSDTAPRESRPAPSLEEHPTRPRDPSESALEAASEALVFRALERAGNRLRQTVGGPPGVPAYETHLHVSANGSARKYLEDAWSCAAQVLDGIADPALVIPTLNSYCITLLNEQAPHDRARLKSWLALSREVSA